MQNPKAEVLKRPGRISRTVGRRCHFCRNEFLFDVDLPLDLRGTTRYLVEENSRHETSSLPGAFAVSQPGYYSHFGTALGDQVVAALP